MNRDFRHVTKLTQTKIRWSFAYFNGVSCRPRRWLIVIWSVSSWPECDTRKTRCHIKRDKFIFQKMKTTKLADIDKTVTQSCQWKFCMCHKRLYECHATNISMFLEILQISGSHRVQVLTQSPFTIMVDESRIIENRYVTSCCPSQLHSIFRAQTFNDRKQLLRVFPWKCDVYTSIAHVFVTTNMSVSFHVR